MHIKIILNRKLKYLNLFHTGNDALHLVTKDRPYILRVDLKDFQNNSAYAIYSQFSVEDSANSYKLSLGLYSGTAGMWYTCFTVYIINKAYGL